MAESPSIIDEEGNLFGVVNIVDALVVLLVLAVIVAGAALVTGGGVSSSNTGTTYVTLDLGEQPNYIASAINEGDTYSPSSNSNLTITDVHIAPGENQPRTVVRAELEGPATDNGIEYLNAQPRLGRQLDVSTAQYTAGGTVVSIGDSETLESDSRTVVIRDTMAAADAREVTAGDEIRLAGRRAAAVEDVAIYPTADANQYNVFMEVELNTYSQQGDAYFGDTPVRRGQSVTLPAEDYSISGNIQRVGGGLHLNSTDVLIETTVDTETAESISVGDVSTVAGYETAEVETVTTYATQDPGQTRVFIGLSLQTVGFGGDRRFSDTALQEGNEISFRTETYQLQAPIERVRSLEQRGTPTNRTVTLELSNVDEAMAETFVTGMTERSGGEPIATVTNVSVEPEVIITAADNGSVNVADHPYLREVTLTTELRVRETTSGVQFKGNTIQRGSTVVLNFGTVTVEADVVTLGA